MPDLYHHPESIGLAVVGELDAGQGYEYDKFAVWTDKRGHLFWAVDAGCSCPTPFEDETLESLNTGPITEMRRQAVSWWDNQYRRDEITRVQVQEFLNLVADTRNRLKGK